MSILERIKQGLRPTQILKEHKQKHPGKRNEDLADWFAEEMQTVFPHATDSIERWGHGREPGNGIDDDLLDRIVLADLREGGLLQKGEGPVVPGIKSNHTEEAALTLARMTAQNKGIEIEPSPTHVYFFPQDKPQTGNDWIFIFQRGEPEHEGRSVNIIVDDETGKSSVAGKA